MTVMAACDPALASTPGADRVLCGLRVRSAFPLPDLLPWTGEDRPVDLRIQAGPVPDDLPGAVRVRPLLQVGADGQCLFALPGVARYLVSADGRDVRIAAAEGAAASEIRTFLFGTVFAILCHRRGFLPLHACCIRVGDAAVAFAGESGVGKSTLALGLRARGFSLLADDITVLDTAAPGAALALPTFPRLKLWRDALERDGTGHEGLEEVRPDLGKYHLAVESSFCAAPLPLAGLVLLNKDRHAADGLQPVPATQALERMGAVLYRPRLMLALGTRGRQMAQFLQVLAAVGGLHTLRRPETAAEWDAMATHLRALSP